MSNRHILWDPKSHKDDNNDQRTSVEAKMLLTQKTNKSSVMKICGSVWRDACKL